MSVSQRDKFNALPEHARRVLVEADVRWNEHLKLLHEALLHMEPTTRAALRAYCAQYAAFSAHQTTIVGVIDTITDCSSAS